MITHLYAVGWNEEKMLGFFFRHYDSWVDRYVIYDDGSSDGSMEILKAHPRVEVRSFERIFTDSFILSKQVVQNNAWKESRGQADWAVLVDIDEHLFVPHCPMPELLERYKAEGVTFVPALGYQMIAEELPGDEEQLCQSRSIGAPWHLMNKPVIFNPDAIEENNSKPGNHTAKPVGRLKLPDRDELLLLHYKYLGLDQTFERFEQLRSKRGTRDVTMKWGIQYFWSNKQLRNDWNHFKNNSVDISRPDFNPLTSKTEERWWRPAWKFYVSRGLEKYGRILFPAMDRSIPVSAKRKIYFIIPTFSPIGGVIKLFDYVNHALMLGYQPIICCNKRYHRFRPLFKNPQFKYLKPGAQTPFINTNQLKVENSDLVFFSLATDYKLIQQKIPADFPRKQMIGVLQGVSHGNREMNNGYNVELLSLPMSRIACSEEIYKAVQPFLHPNSLVKMITLGHNSNFFKKQRSGGFGSPINVLYTTWKTKFGDEIAKSLENKNGKFKFQSIRGNVTWEDLRKKYHWADVFLSTPDFEEGIYLPGLEAMAAGAIVITPDAIGNRAYCQFNINCLYTERGDKDSYLEALDHVSKMDSGEIDSMRFKAYQAVQKFSLENEKKMFGEFLDKILA